MSQGTPLEHLLEILGLLLSDDTKCAQETGEAVSAPQRSLDENSAENGRNPGSEICRKRGNYEAYGRRPNSLKYEKLEKISCILKRNKTAIWNFEKWMFQIDGIAFTTSNSFRQVRFQKLKFLYTKRVNFIGKY